MLNQKVQKDEGGKLINPEHLKKAKEPVDGPDQPKLKYEQLMASMKEDVEFLELRSRVQRAKAEIASYTWQEITMNHKIVEYKLQQQEAEKNAVEGKPNETEEK